MDPIKPVRKLQVNLGKTPGEIWHIISSTHSKETDECMKMKTEIS